MNEELAAVKSHAELIVGDLLRRTLNIYEKELSSSGVETTTDNTVPEMDSIGDQMLMIERIKVGDSKTTKGKGEHEDQIQMHSGSPKSTSVYTEHDCDGAIGIIEKTKADTTRISSTLKLFNRHKTLPAIPERVNEEK